MREAAISLIAGYDDRVTVYTDGSVAGGNGQGGSAVVVTTGSPLSPTVVETLKKKGNPRTCSYETEIDALHMAVDWLHSNGQPDCLICTDSQSSTAALCSLPHSQAPRVDELRAKLDRYPGAVAIQWVPSHVNIEGNEAADKAAKAAMEDPGDDAGTLTWAAVRGIVKQEIRDKELEHHLVKITHRKRAKNQLPTRARQVRLARLRSGHHPKLQGYRGKFLGEDPRCLRCGEEDEDVIHWLQNCPATMQQRLNVFGDPSPPLSSFYEWPERVDAFAQLTLGHL